MIVQKLRETKGGAFIAYMIIIMLLFPLIIASYSDLTSIFRISKMMKRSLNCAAKSAASAVDWLAVPTTGMFQIDPGAARDAFKEIMDLNLGFEANAVGGYYEYTDSSGRIWRYYLAITNVQHEGVFEDFPTVGSIPAQVTSKPIQVKVDRPTVVGIATCDYTVMNALGGRTVKIIQVAAAQLTYHSPN